MKIDDILQYLQNPNMIAALSGVVSFIIAVPFFIISLFQHNEPKISLKIGGACFVTSLAFVANNTMVFALAIFIIATFITKLDFLENIAAIFWDHKEFWEYRASLTKAASKEVRNKIDNEIKQEPELRKISDSIATARAKILKFETNAIAALKTSTLFPNSYISTQVRLRIGRRVKHVIDAMIHTPRTIYIAEIKASSNQDAIERAVDQVQNYMKAYIAYTLRTNIIPTIKGIIIIPSNVSVSDFVRGIAILKFDPTSESFINIKLIKRWILNTENLDEELLK